MFANLFKIIERNYFFLNFRVCLNCLKCYAYKSVNVGLKIFIYIYISRKYEYQ